MALSRDHVPGLQVIDLSSMTHTHLRLSMLLYRAILDTREKGQDHVGYALQTYIYYHIFTDQLISENLSIKYDLNMSESSSWTSEQKRAYKAINKSYGASDKAGDSKILAYCDLMDITIHENLVKIAHHFAAFRNIAYHSTVHRHWIGYFPTAAHDLLTDFKLRRFVDGEPPSWIDRMCRADVMDEIASFFDMSLYPALSCNIPIGNDAQNACKFSSIKREAIFPMAHIRQLGERGILNPQVLENELSRLNHSFSIRSHRNPALRRP